MAAEPTEAEKLAAKQREFLAEQAKRHEELAKEYEKQHGHPPR